MGSLAIRNLTQTRIEGKMPSTGLGRMPSLIIVASGGGSRRKNLLNLLKGEPSFNSRVIAICNDVESADSNTPRYLKADPLACPSACEAVRKLVRDEDGVASILIDLSCLTRQHIGALFSAV